MHIILYIFLSLTWESAIFRKGRRKNSFKFYLVFFMGLLHRFLSFTGERNFCRTWLKALLSSVQRFCSTLSQEFWLINQHVFSRSLSVPKTKNPLPNFLWPKSYYFWREGFWPIIWPLSSPSTSSCHATHSGYHNDLYPLLCPTNLGLWSADRLTCILTASVVSRCAC